MRILPIISTLFLAKHSAALYKDEAGQNDFTISTAGHGVFGSTYAQITSDQTSVLTSSSSSNGTPIDNASSRNDDLGGGCYISSRSLKNGSLNWRRNACSRPSTKDSTAIRHAVFSMEEDNRVYTLEDSGMIRIWNDTNGSMVKEIPFSLDLPLTSGVPRIVGINFDLMGGILTTDETEVMIMFNDEVKDTILSAKDLLGKAKLKNRNVGDVPSIFGVSSESEDSFYVVVGWAHTDAAKATTSFSDMAMVKITLEDGVIKTSKDCKSLSNGSQESLLVSSIAIDDGNIVARKSGKDELISYSISKGSEESSGSGISINCNGMIVGGDSLQFNSPITSMHKLQCTDFFVTVLASTEGGNTGVFTVKRGKDAEILWTSEEGLADASSAIFLDKGATKVDDSIDDEEELIASLSFSSRLSSQWDSLSAFVTGGFIGRISDLFGGSAAESHKDALFGLHKVAVLLSDHFNKVLAIDTESKGSIAWTVDLNPKASWHKVVHGAASSHSSALGQGKHHPHSPEILVLSQTADTVEWKCIDGLRGRIISQSSVNISTPMIQVIPVHGHSHAHGGCKQNAALVFEDDSLLFLPRAPKTVENQLYSHVVDKATGVFRSMKVNANVDGTGTVETVGETFFDPRLERIITVSYPQRNEVVQSPATILGDDSLLVKYLNPHLCVIVTEATVEYMEDAEGTQSAIFKALESSPSSNGGKKVPTKKKPVGATKPGEKAPPQQATLVPTLFVNLVDTVSGQVLHRASHAHASLGAMPAGASNVPVAISENWIVYAFKNVKSRHTEIGVLTLHEGMIHKHGITAFSTPEQQLTFSSLSSSNPIVLAKTYGVTYPVSAIGVTNTKGGISSKNFLLATGSAGQLVKIDRRLLDPRRPYGEPKKTEKKEGLLQYAPFLPLSPMSVQSYTNDIVDPSLIISTAANLESQTLILALGGPDIFFTRFAPSKGFDSLPDSFNKLAIVIVVIGLFMVLKALKRMGENKSVKLFWS